MPPTNPHAPTPSAPRAPRPAAQSARPSKPSGGSSFGRPGAQTDDDFVIDLDGVDLSGGFVGPGEWLGYATSVIKKESKAGNPMLEWQFQAYDGPYAGRSIKMWTALTPDALWKLAETLQAYGVEETRPTFGQIKEATLGVFVTLVVVEQEYNGQIRGSLDRVLSPEDFGHEIGTRVPRAGTPR